jgi:hypothetical protein
MELIEEFEYVKGKNDITGDFIFTKGSIKTEVPRSRINFYNSEEKFVEMDWSKYKIYSQKLSGYNYNKRILSVKELEFLSEIYGFKTYYDKEREVFRATLKKIHPDFTVGYLEYFKADGKGYLVISFDRKSEHLPPQAEEDITCYLGIWENPLLTDEIIEKIKQP